MSNFFLMLDIPSFAKPFRFEEMWLSDRGCSNIVEAVWLSRGEEEDHDHVNAQNR